MKNFLTINPRQALDKSKTMNFLNDTSTIKPSGTVPELRLYYKSSPLSDEPLTDTETAVKLLRQIFDEGTIELQEQSVIVMLDEADRPICYYHVSSGLKEKHDRDHRLLLQILVAVNPTKFIMAHNHPGSSAFPSPEDIDATFTFKRKAEFFDYIYYDEIIISKDGHYSFADSNLLW